VKHGITHQGQLKRTIGDGAPEQVISFADPDGLLLEIVGHPSAETRPAWANAPGITRDNAIHGFHAVTVWLSASAESERVLTETLGFHAIGELESTRRFAVADGGPGAFVDVRTIGDFARGAGGAGTVHHVAFRVPDDATELEVRSRVARAGLHPTPVIDRNYFHSVYFREPGGVLYELATNPPGFAVDEPLEHLGERLMLPAQYEPHRWEIEAVLPAIHLGVPSAATSLFANADGPEDVSGEALGFVHRYIPPNAGGELAGGTTLLMLHGTGGDEEDLIPVGRELLPGAGILSPRGKVLERGAPRFFRRVAEGVFDQEDLALRTEELASFVEAATATYQLEADGIVAVGFSNGANIAASMLFRHPGLLGGAVLFSPMVPFEPQTMPRLDGTSIFIGAGRSDPIAPPLQAERLASLFRQCGADVTVHWEPGGHALTRAELAAARDWLAGVGAKG
jgi:predicted esterase/catechol 2,3-dioxygenase-like lactoylglutathione lyase family enzyme